MDTVPVLYSLRVSQIQTYERLVLEHQVKDLLLEFAAVGTVIFSERATRLWLSMIPSERVSSPRWRLFSDRSRNFRVLIFLMILLSAFAN